MSPDVLFALFIAVPVLVLMVLRINASLVFLSACLGVVLLKYMGPDAEDFTKGFVPALSGNNLKLFLLLLPVVLTAVFMIKTVKGARLAFNLLPAAGVGLLLAFVTVPLLSHSLSHQIQSSTTWSEVQKLQSLIVGLSALVCLFFIWLQRPKHNADDKHGKHH